LGLIEEIDREIWKGKTKVRVSMSRFNKCGPEEREAIRQLCLVNGVELILDVN
jgi:hypothetical protein